MKQTHHELHTHWDWRVALSTLSSQPARTVLETMLPHQAWKTPNRHPRQFFGVVEIVSVTL